MAKFNIQKDPKFFQVEKPGPARKLVLGLDLGTTTGYALAYQTPDANPVSLILPQHIGQLDLSAGSYDSGAIRFVRLRQFLSVISPDAIFYEDVKNDPPGGMSKFSVGAVIARIATASELLGAFRATVCTWAEENGIPCTGFKIGTIKKRATGKGNSNKEDIIKACNALIGSDLATEGYELLGTDNVADAVFVTLLGLEQYGQGFTYTDDRENGKDS